MLSELGKFGASFILATQSLAKLDDLSPTMRDTILANVGCLAVFRCRAATPGNWYGSWARSGWWRTTSPPWTCTTATCGPPWERSGCPPSP